MTTKVPNSMLADPAATQASIDTAVAGEVTARNAAIAAAISALPASGSVPAGTLAPYAGTAAPAGWLLAFGQAVSRATYADLFTAISTAYGAGDGSTTFALPDMRGRVIAAKDDMGGSAAGRLAVTLTGTKASTANGNISGLSSTAGLAVGMKAFGTGIGANAVIAAITSGSTVTLSVNSTSAGSTSIRFAVVDGATLGAVGGAQVHTLAIEQMPAHTHDYLGFTGSGGSDYTPGGSTGPTTTATSTTGGGQAHPVVQPTIVLNYIIKT